LVVFVIFPNDRTEVIWALVLNVRPRNWFFDRLPSVRPPVGPM